MVAQVGDYVRSECSHIRQVATIDQIQGINLAFAVPAGNFLSFLLDVFSDVSNSREAIELMSMLIDRLIRRPPDSDIPRQFLNDSVIRAYVGIVVIVLSQF